MSELAVARPVDDLSARPISRDRRLIGRALEDWDRLRGRRAFPSCRDFDDSAVPDDKPHVFVVEIGAEEGEDRIIRAGRAVIAALGLNPVGRRATDVLPSAVDRGLSFCRTVATHRKPIADAGKFTNVAGVEIQYRSIMLPSSSDQQRIDYVVGALSFRILD